jgi:YGGT family
MVPISPSNRFMRFTDSLIDPLMDPIRKRIPSSSMGAVNLAYTIAFIFAWWGLRILAAIILIALPYGW